MDFQAIIISRKHDDPEVLNIKASSIENAYRRFLFYLSNNGYFDWEVVYIDIYNEFNQLVINGSYKDAIVLYQNAVNSYNYSQVVPFDWELFEITWFDGDTPIYFHETCGDFSDDGICGCKGEQKVTQLP